MLLLLPAALFLLIGTSECQKVIKLNTFPGRAITVIPATAPYHVYVSANSDSDDLLSQMFIVTLQSRMISLFDLKQKRAQEPFRYSLPHPVKRRATLYSELTEEQMKNITGFLYTTTANQAEDRSFFVSDIDQLMNVQVGGSEFENSTLVFLNSNTSMTPGHSSVISKWKQSSDASVSIYQGVPSDEPEKNNTHFFSNPVSTSDGMRFIPTVEKFCVSLPVFYMRTNKKVEFSIAPEYLELNMTRTYELTSTGFYMKPFGQPDHNITVVTMRTSTYFKQEFKKSVGANVVGSMPEGSTVTVMEAEDDATDGFTVTPSHEILGFSTPNIGWNITISSNNATEGQFFVQYYVIGYGYNYLYYN